MTFPNFKSTSDPPITVICPLCSKISPLCSNPIISNKLGGFFCSNQLCQGKRTGTAFNIYFNEQNQIVHLYCPIIIHNTFYSLLASDQVGMEVCSFSDKNKSHLQRFLLWHSPNFIQVPLDFIPYTINIINRVRNLQSFS